MTGNEGPTVSSLQSALPNTDDTDQENKDTTANTTSSNTNNDNDGDDDNGNNNNNKVMIGKYTEEFLLERARALVAERTGDWEIPNQQAEDRIPRFHRDEIEIGKLIGKGGYFYVIEVKEINLRDDEAGDDSEILPESYNSINESSRRTYHDEEDYIQGVVQNRRFMQKHCMRVNKHGKKECRYALKTMKPEHRSGPSRYVNTVVDLAIEAKFLSAVRHPNIIKMRAMSVGDLCQPHAFIILDRLYDTLMERIQVWKKKEQTGLHKILDFGKKRQHSFFASRLVVAYDIASALHYLHELNIIYRDLKPNNIGFDVRGDAKLFDFGLATEFDAEKEKNKPFKLTGDTGTIRYMAPEVALQQPYNELADVYSFGILLWEICAMEMPYEDTPEADIERKVIQCGVRPRIHPSWPNPIRRLMQDLFASKHRRPKMDVVCDVLMKEINKMANKKLVDSSVEESARSALSDRYYN